MGFSGDGSLGPRVTGTDVVGDGRSLPREFSGFDARDRCRVVGMIVADVVHDFVVVLKHEFAVRTGVRLGHVVASSLVWWCWG